MQQQNLDAYVLKRSVPHLQRARFFPGKLLFYFDYVCYIQVFICVQSKIKLKCMFYLQLDDTETCVKFTIERWYPVANMSRYLPVRVYDYYAPGLFLYLTTNNII